MKKIIVLCLCCVILLSMSITAFAAPGAFVSSPSGNSAPVLVDFEKESPDCFADLKIVPYSQRNTLDEAARKKIEDAYSHIVDSIDGSDFSKILEKLAKEKGVSVSNLSVSDLFDISAYNCDHHENHEGFIITIKSENVDGAIGLLHLSKNGWEIVKITDINKEKDTMTFQVDELSPFAIVVDNGNGSSTPQTGDTSMIYLWVVIAVASASLLIVLSLKFKAKK